MVPDWETLLCTEHVHSALPDTKTDEKALHGVGTAVRGLTVQTENKTGMVLIEGNIYLWAK